MLCGLCCYVPDEKGYKCAHDREDHLGHNVYNLGIVTDLLGHFCCCQFIHSMRSHKSFQGLFVIMISLRIMKR